MNLVRMNDDMEFSIRDTKIITFWKNNNKNVKNIHKFSTFSSLFLDQGVVWTARELGIFLMTIPLNILDISDTEEDSNICSKKRHL